MNKLFISAIAMSLSVPSIVAPAVVDAAEHSFTDIPKGHVYYEIINEMASKGIINGYIDGTFRPNEHITRQHAAVLISRAADLKPTVTYRQFKDVPSNHPYFSAITESQQAGIFNPNEEGDFEPNEVITREEMAKALAIAFNLTVTKVEKSSFSDVSTTNEYAPYIEAVFRAGISSGYQDGTFKPKEPLSRVHYSLLMFRSMNQDKRIKPDINVTGVSKNLSDYPTNRFNNDLVIKSRDFKDFNIPGGWTNVSNILKAQKETAKKIITKNKIGASSSFSYFTVYTDPESIKALAERLGITNAEAIQIINYAEATGNVYDGKTFYLYIDYANGNIVYGRQTPESLNAAKKVSDYPKDKITVENKSLNDLLTLSDKEKTALLESLQETAKEIAEDRGYDRKKSITYRANTTYRENLINTFINQQDISKADFIQQINYVIDTSEIYDSSNNYIMYFDLEKGVIIVQYKLNENSTNDLSNNDLSDYPKNKITAEDKKLKDVTTLSNNEKEDLLEYHEKKAKKIVKVRGFDSEKTITYSSKLSLRDRFIEYILDELDISRKKYNQIVNYIIDTGELYDGKDYIMYFNYVDGLVIIHYD